MIVRNLETTSGGWYRPLAYALSKMESDRPKVERGKLVDLLSTAAEFYDMGARDKEEEIARREAEKQDDVPVS